MKNLKTESRLRDESKSVRSSPPFAVLGQVKKRMKSSSPFKNQKLVFLFLIIFLASLLFPLVSLAGSYQAGGKTINYTGLVPCGKSQAGPGESNEVKIPCQFCHGFVMFKGILDFVLKLIIVIAVAMFVYGGFLYLTSGVNPSQLQTAMKILTSTVIGLVIIFAAWIIVNTIFIFLGTASWTGLQSGWFTINCPIKLP